jgi:hypothetical protein
MTTKGLAETVTQFDIGFLFFGHRDPETLRNRDRVTADGPDRACADGRFANRAKGLKQLAQPFRAAPFSGCLADRLMRTVPGRVDAANAPLNTCP